MELIQFYELSNPWVERPDFVSLESSINYRGKWMARYYVAYETVKLLTDSLKVK